MTETSVNEIYLATEVTKDGLPKSANISNQNISIVNFQAIEIWRSIK